jgi:hypothetical protein
VKKLVFVLAFAALALPSAALAKPVVLKTNWHERFDFTLNNRHAQLRLHVRRIEFTNGSWKAYVGLTNRSGFPLTMTTGTLKERPDQPYTYFAGPGIWWSSFKRGASWYPGGGTVLTNTARASSVRPAYPSSLAAGKSWFGVFTGAVAPVDKQRLLRIGFGVIPDATAGWDPRNGGALVRADLPVSTTHQFKLPKGVGPTL